MYNLLGNFRSKKKRNQHLKNKNFQFHAGPLPSLILIKTSEVRVYGSLTNWSFYNLFIYLFLFICIFPLKLPAVNSTEPQGLLLLVIILFVLPLKINCWPSSVFLMSQISSLSKLYFFVCSWLKMIWINKNSEIQF